MNEIEVDFLHPTPSTPPAKHFQDFGNASQRGMFWKFRNIFLINFIPRMESTRAEPEGVHSSILFFNKTPEGKYESTPVWGPIDFPFKLLSIPSVNEK